MLVQDGLERNAAASPGKTALVCCGRRLTYAEVDLAANRLANALIANGVNPADRIVICLPNNAEAVIGVYATLKASATFVVLNPTMSVERLNGILSHCGATALITDYAMASRCLDCRIHDGSSPQMIIVTGAEGSNEQTGLLHWERAQAGYPADLPPRRNIDLDLACLVYTSGSTGEPKGVMCDHSNVVFVMESVMTYLENTSQDVLLNVLPLSSSYGLYQVLMAFTFGGTLVLEPAFTYPGVILQRIMQENVTGFPGVPTLFAMLLRLDLQKVSLPSLRYMTNAAAALPPAHIRQLRAALPHVRIYSMHGLTETKRTLYLPPEQIDIRPDSVGIAIPGTQAWIADEEGRRLGPNQVGELIIRGRHVMRGYWGDPKATALRFVAGPLPGERVCRTGDLFRMDEEGFLYFVGRKEDIIKSRGGKVAPREVEIVLCTLPGVTEAVVVGVPDPVLGEAVKAVIVGEPSRVTRAAVIAHCRAHLEDFKVPTRIEFRDQLPRSAAGKVEKRALVECAASPE